MSKIYRVELIFKSVFSTGLGEYNLLPIHLNDKEL